MKKIYIALIFILLTSNLYSQKETYTWYFGDSAAISFMPDGNSPHALTGSLIEQMEGCASISDRDGNMMYYSDGVKLWNKDNIEITAGFRGDNSSSRSVIIVPKPRSNRYYYIFAIDAYEDYKNINGITYSVLDILANKGRGDILLAQRNVKLLANAVEKMITINHANQEDIWLVAYNWKDNSFYTYHITKDSIKAPVITKRSGEVIENPQVKAGFNLEYDIRQKKLINCAASTHSFEIYDFNNATGKIDVANMLSIPAFEYTPEDIINDSTIKDSINMYVPYSGAFSEDGRKFYASCYTIALFQFDFSSPNIDDILASRVRIADSAAGDGSTGALRMGPDGKIYVACNKSEYLAVIDKPNEAGKACNYIRDALYLEGGRCRRGLPVMMAYTVPPCDFTGYAGGNKTVCSGGSVLLGDNIQDSSNYTFSWLPNKYLDRADILHPACTPAETIQYILQVTDTVLNCTDYDTVTVYVNTAPTILQADDAETCRDSPVTIGNTENSNEYTYNWSPGTYLSSTDSKTAICTPEADMTYILTVTDMATGCTSYDTVKVTLKKIDGLSIEGDKYICYGASSILTVVGEFAEYLWSTGAATKSITVDNAGIYTVSVIDAYGCKGEASFEVLNFDSTKVQIIAPTAICEGSVATLYTEDTYAEYLWSTGAATPSIDISSEGTYWLTVKNGNGCTASDTVTVAKEQIKYSVTDSIAFGGKCVTDVISQDIAITNTGGEAFVISSLDFENTASCFTIAAMPLPLHVDANSTVTVKIYFDLQNAGTCTDELLIKINNPCEATIHIPVSGSSANTSIRAASQDFEITPGDSLKIPVSFSINSNGAAGDTPISFTFEYAYNKTLMQVRMVQCAGVVEVTSDGNLEILTIRKEIPPGATADTITLYAVSFMGDTSVAPLYIQNFATDLPCIDFEGAENTLRLQGCAINLRSIRFFKPTELKVHTELGNIICDVATEEQGDICLELYDMAGASIAKHIWHRKASIFEHRAFGFPAVFYASNVYFVKLTTVASTITQKHIFIR